jgi:hypothetical protein
MKLVDTYMLEAEEPINELTVWRAVDYFQPMCGDPDVYTATLPFSIQAHTMSSTSISENEVSQFINASGMGCMLSLTVPATYKKFLAMASTASKYGSELELLLPDDAIFEITSRSYVYYKGARRVVLTLYGRVAMPRTTTDTNTSQCGRHCTNDVHLDDESLLSGGAATNQMSQRGVSQSRRFFRRPPPTLKQK